PFENSILDPAQCSRYQFITIAAFMDSGLALWTCRDPSLFRLVEWEGSHLLRWLGRVTQRSGSELYTVESMKDPFRCGIKQQKHDLMKIPRLDGLLC
ncbi:hypothetical protein AVEN_91936-1, partial [Araneus ventricosus]